MSKRICCTTSVLLLALSACGSATRGGAASGSRAHPAGASHGPGGDQDTLAFSIKVADTWNHFFRRGPVAAHLLVTSGATPRLVTAFPAGNAGIGLWFDPPPSPLALAVKGPLRPVLDPGGLRGVRAELHIDGPQLRASGVVLSSVRVLRDYANDPATLPKQIVNQVDVGPPLMIKRTTIDGQHHLELRVEAEAGAAASVDDRGGLVLSAAPGKQSMDVALTFLQDDSPLTPIPLDQLLTADAAPSVRDRQVLSFLTYREKMLAGSWRFLTYFGRDTLMTVCLLMPVLKPAGIEGGLGAVIDRLDPGGDVAHEEDIGEFAALDNQRAGRAPTTEPVFDYKMVDDDFMLAPVLARYLLDTDAGKKRAADFLARRTPGGLTYAEAVGKNLALVSQRTAAFVGSPRAKNLISIKDGVAVGDWRDSQEGLGGGRYPYDVNVALAPAALDAAARLYDSGLLCGGLAATDASCTSTQAQLARSARAAAAVWQGKAAGFFQVSVPVARARAMIRAYASAQGFDPGPALAALDGPVVFPALSLTRGGRPVPVMQSDDGFALLFDQPAPAVLDRIAHQVARPFPLGLMTPVGMVIANPTFVSDKKKQALFARDRYHGAVVWSWQQALMAAGLARQLERTDLPDATRAALTRAQTALWQAIAATKKVRQAEDWSWQIQNGAFTLYNPAQGKDSESNAAQLWSTVYLAVQPPRGM